MFARRNETELKQFQNSFETLFCFSFVSVSFHLSGKFTHGKAKASIVESPGLPIQMRVPSIYANVCTHVTNYFRSGCLRNAGVYLALTTSRLRMRSYRFAAYICINNGERFLSVLVCKRPRCLYLYKSVYYYYYYYH